MSEQFKFSDPGEGLQEAEILEVHVSAGDSVSDGDTVLTVETDKANTDIPAPFTGTIDEVQVSEGDMVEIGDVLMTYSEDDDSSDDEDQETGSDDKDKEEKDEDKDSDSGKRKKETKESESKSDKNGKDKKAGKKDDEKTSEEDDDDHSEDQTEETESAEKEQSASKKKKSGKGKSDSQQKRAKSTEDESSAEKRGDKREPVPAAPSTRRLAREKGVDLHDIEPSGPNGRVTAEDVEAAAQSREDEKTESEAEETTSALTPGLTPSALPDLGQWGEIEREPLRSIRRATARNMARSWAEIPHVFHQDIADVTELERFRREHSAEHGKLTLTVLVMKALVGVLKRFPRFNASLDVQNQKIVYKHYFHMGLAVATERGLLVPVIRDVDRKNLVELAAEADDIAHKTRNGELSRADMQGGSITVTNPGPLGGTSLTPLINQPQVAILGMARARLEPVVSGDLDDYRIEPRLRLPLVLGFDHRVNDGADAARFVSAVIEALADPESLLLTV